jgi:hypothetical protein
MPLPSVSPPIALHCRGYPAVSVGGVAAALKLKRGLALLVLHSEFAPMPANPVRHFRSFSEAARENADSRVKAGLHFRFATQAGLELGRQIGQHTNRHLLPRQHGSQAQDD